ncbi:MAG: hypothetical protein HYR72_04410 [Deltaproteobacteria bacterium]|nr:hypothetical protein [Deltaproteobacteria bacterium]MBI3389937.1 hypothetical protein [Deltaproteobacteria bacterium]
MSKQPDSTARTCYQATVSDDGPIAVLSRDDISIRVYPRRGEFIWTAGPRFPFPLPVIPAIFWNGESDLWHEPFPVMLELQAHENGTVIDPHKVTLRLPRDAVGRPPSVEIENHLGLLFCQPFGQEELEISTGEYTKILLWYHISGEFAPKTLQLEIDGLRRGAAALPPSILELRLVSDWIVCRSPYL